MPPPKQRPKEVHCTCLYIDYNGKVLSGAEGQIGQLMDIWLDEYLCISIYIVSI